MEKVDYAKRDTLKTLCSLISVPIAVAISACSQGTRETLPESIETRELPSGIDIDVARAYDKLKKALPHYTLYVNRTGKGNLEGMGPFDAVHIAATEGYVEINYRKFPEGDDVFVTIYEASELGNGPVDAMLHFGKGHGAQLLVDYLDLLDPRIRQLAYHK